MLKSKFYFLVLFWVGITYSISAQNASSEKIEAINNYVNFSNECTHGLLIVHRLLETFNKNINKYVDLPDQQVNFYTNKDLPLDIFEDQENLFYDISPNEWYVKINENKGNIPTEAENQWKVYTNEMKKIISSINQIRFKLEEQINTLDLTKRENLSLIYDRLEEAVTLFKNYYVQQNKLEVAIKKYCSSSNIAIKNTSYPIVLSLIDSVYQAQRVALNDLYTLDDSKLNEHLAFKKKILERLMNTKLSDYNSPKLLNAKVQMYWANINRQAKESVKEYASMLDLSDIPDEFNIYGRHYYYYNTAMINKFNRYGNGIVFEINRIIEYLNVPIPRYFEMPHYLKVVYPRKFESAKELNATQFKISNTPTTVNARTVRKADKTIFVDASDVPFQLLDRKIIDNDIVSINYNGDWIVKKYKLGAKPYEFNIRLNAEGKNFILLHADDVGRQPPATISLSYTYKGKKEEIVLSSDTATSELIEIILKP